MSTKYPNQPSWYQKPNEIFDINDALEDVQVHAPGMWENNLSDHPLLKEWYAVSTGCDSIVAYFASETDAMSFRLKIIDRWFNG